MKHSEHSISAAANEHLAASAENFSHPRRQLPHVICNSARRDSTRHLRARRRLHAWHKSFVSDISEKNAESSESNNAQKLRAARRHASNLASHRPHRLERTEARRLEARQLATRPGGRRTWLGMRIHLACQCSPWNCFGSTRKASIAFLSAIILVRGAAATAYAQTAIRCPAVALCNTLMG